MPEHNHLQQAIKAIKAGDKENGKQLLTEILKTNPWDENAWLWMTQVVSSNDERIRCIQNVLKINPNNEAAKRGLATFQQKSALSRLEQVESPKTGIQPKGAESNPITQKPYSNSTDNTPLSQEIKPIETIDTKKCPYCAEVIKAEATFCQYCGQNLSIEQQCPSCHTSVSIGSKFCASCGTRIVLDSSISTQIPPTQYKSQLSQRIRKTEVTDKKVIIREIALVEEKLTIAETQMVVCQILCKSVSRLTGLSS